MCNCCRPAEDRIKEAESKKKGYHLIVDVDDIEGLIKAIGGVFTDTLRTVKERLDAGEPVRVDELATADKVNDNPTPAEECWKQRFADVSSPLGVLGAIMAFKRQTGCTMCVHEIESFAEAYFQKCAKTFAAWLSDLPSDPQARRDYLASRCWEKR